jgi:Tudor domain
MSGELLAQTDLVDLKNPEVGDVVAARFADDNLLYRAKVLNSCEGDSMMVHFLDYGNTTVSC